MGRAHLFERDELVEHVVVEHEGHGAIARIGLETEETLRGVVGFHVAHARGRDESVVLFAIGGEGHAAVEENFEVGPHLIERFCACTFEHFHDHRHHPRRNPRNRSHVFVEGFFGNELTFAVEIFE